MNTAQYCTLSTSQQTAFDQTDAYTQALISASDSVVLAEYAQILAAKGKRQADFRACFMAMADRGLFKYHDFGYMESTVLTADVPDTLSSVWDGVISEYWNAQADRLFGKTEYTTEYADAA